MERCESCNGEMTPFYDNMGKFGEVGKALGMVCISCGHSYDM